MTVQAFLDARDFLLRHRTDYETAYRDFAWPVLDTFNWALDYFDPMARGNDRPALWIVDGATGTGEPYSFAQMSERSSRIANWLRGIGVGRGDRILLMLPNRVELWDAMLAAMKLGAIVLPATTQLSADDVRDRVQIGGAKYAIVDENETAKFEQPGLGLAQRIVAGAPRDGWLAMNDGYAASAAFEPDAVTHANDPMLLYFTSGTRRRNRSSSSIRTAPIRSVICRRCTGSGCSRATSTGTSARPVGPSTRGAASTRRGMRRPACSRSTMRVSRRRPCSMRSSSTA